MLCGMENQGSWARLGDAVRRRRDRLGVTQEDVAAKGGPSTATLRSIEAGATTSYRAKTLYSLDAALGWMRGTSIAIAEGEVPSHFAFSTFDEFVEAVVRDVSAEIARGHDFPVGRASAYDPSPEPPPQGPPTDEWPFKVDPNSLSEEEAKRVIDAMLAVIIRRGLEAKHDSIDPRHPQESHHEPATTEADVETGAGRPEDYDLAGPSERRGKPAPSEQGEPDEMNLP